MNKLDGFDFGIAVLVTSGFLLDKLGLDFQTQAFIAMPLAVVGGIAAAVIRRLKLQRKEEKNV